MMKDVLFVAAESAPFIKTGGLGSVMGSLPLELNKLNTKVGVVIPAYECIPDHMKEKMKYLLSFPVHLGWRNQMADVFTAEVSGVTYYFIGNVSYFCGDSPYGKIWEDVEKFAFFSIAVLEMLSYLELPVDIIHCHDWQTGLLPVFLKTFYAADPYFRKIKTIMTIHNILFQGVLNIDQMKDITGLPDEAFAYDKLECYGNANMLKGGIVYADLVTTVSESYAKEIQTPEYGMDLFHVLEYRQKDLYGIVNGIDWELYNPKKDPHVASPYDVDDFENNRLANKMALQELCGMPVGEDHFTMGIVSRLTSQKGYDLLEDSLDTLFEEGAQLYVLGAGEKSVEDIFLAYKERYPDQIYMESNYQDAIAKAIYAGCDITLMPSRFEPCGLNQMMALRYGCLPVVRATGGLKDTVTDENRLVLSFSAADGSEEKKTEEYAETDSAKTVENEFICDGFVFERYAGLALKACLERAKNTYDEKPEEWKKRIRNGMKKDFSWKASAKEYEKLYNLDK